MQVNSVQVLTPVQSVPYWFQVDSPVIFDKTISAQAKVVYAIISGLTQKTGECWASNAYIAELIDVSKDTISRCISELFKAGHISSIVGNDYRRTITLSYVRASQKCLEGTAKTPRGIGENAEGDRQKPVDNNINELDKLNIQVNKAFSPPTLTEVELYCIERNNGLNASNFIDYYSARGWMLGKQKMKDWRAAVRTWENRSKQERNGGSYGKQSGYSIGVSKEEIERIMSKYES